MAKGKRMTLKQAAELLKSTEYPYGLPAIQKAATAGKLRVRLETAPIEHYTVLEADLLAWATDPAAHRPGPRAAKGSKS